MIEFQSKTLGEFIELKRGYDLPARVRTAGEFSLVSSSGPSDTHNEAKAKGPGVVTGRYGTIGQVFFVKADFWPLNTTLYVRDFKGNDPQFVYYFLKTLDWQKFNDKSGVPGVNRNDAHREPIRVPDLTTQKAIANTLGSLDDKIELNRRMNETLEAMAQAIFRDWFVDFGPTRRKIDGVTDPVEIMGGLVADPDRARELAELFPASMDDSGLPEGWPLRALEESLVLQRGFDLPKTTRHDGEYPVIAASGFNGNHNEYKVIAPGVCTGRSGVLGNVFYVQSDFWPLNTSLWVKHYPNATPIYAYFVLREIDLRALNAGSAVPTLNRNHVHGRPIVKPPMPVISAFSEIAVLLMEATDAATRQNEALSATRDLLLPKLMSGEIRLDYARAQAEEAA